jgi:hypothetical protein
MIKIFVFYIFRLTKISIFITTFCFISNINLYTICKTEKISIITVYYTNKLCIKIIHLLTNTDM